MKKSVVLLLLLLISVCMFANEQHIVSVGVVTSGGAVPTEVVDPELLVTFTGNLYRSGSPVGGQVEITEDTSSCYYYENGSYGVVVIDIKDCTSNWLFGDVLVINVSFDDEIGQGIIVIGSIGDTVDEVPVGQGIQLLDVTPVTCNTTLVEVTEELTYGDFALTPTGTGIVNISAPLTDFGSLPTRGGRANNVDQCFSVDFTDGISQLTTSFSWAASSIIGSTSDKDLIVSVDGVNWIYSDNSASGITIGDVTWDFNDTPDEMTVTFTTTQDNALYAVSNGTDPDVTIPNSPAGGTASRNAGNVTISCRAVSVPGATYQVYYSDDFTSWDDNSIGSYFYASGGMASKTVPHTMGSDIVYYGIKAYNDNDSFQSGIGKTIYTYQTHSFVSPTVTNMTNLIPIPFDGFNNSFTTAEDLGSALDSNCNAVVKWDATTQLYSYCTQYAGAWRGNFDLEPDGVYFVNLTGAVAAKTYDGLMNTSDFELKTGVNLIYVSALEDVTLTNASDLMTAIGAHCTKVQQWDVASQTWSTYTGTDFTLTKLSPVFVYVDANVAYKK